MSELESKLGKNNEEENGLLGSLGSKRGRRRLLTKLAWVLSGLAIAAYSGFAVGKGSFSLASAA